MGGWEFPKGVYKDLDTNGLDAKSLIRLHDDLHTLWHKLKEGYKFSWNFLEIAIMHKIVIDTIENKKLFHVSPIDALDKINVPKGDFQKYLDTENDFQFKILPKNEKYSVKSLVEGKDKLKNLQEKTVYGKENLKEAILLVAKVKGSKGAIVKKL